MLDTNVVLDWLVFADHQVQGLRDAITSRRLRWLACPAMRSELAHMLVHRDLQRWAPQPAAALATFDMLAEIASADPAHVPTALVCRDRDDQVFVDLAVAGRARWLLTRDRALLALARRARARGLEILTPARWTLPD